MNELAIMRARRCLSLFLALIAGGCHEGAQKPSATTDATRPRSVISSDTTERPVGSRTIDTMPSIDSLAVLAKRYPPSATAPTSRLNVTPGSSLIDVSQLHPYHRTYTIFSYACEPTTGEPPTRSGEYTDELTLLGDSAILRVETWHRGTDPEVRDSTILNGRTLALHSSVGHSDHWSDLWIVRNGKASFWSSDMNVPPSQTVDTIIGEPAFGGTIEILLGLTPRAYPGDVSVSYRALGLLTHPGDTPEITVSDLAVRTVDTATAQPLGGPARPVWVVAADDGATFWIDRENRTPLGWDVPQDESICEQKYVLRL